MKINKKIIKERYDNYGDGFEKHVKEMGGCYDSIVCKILNSYISKDSLLLDVAGGDGFATSLLGVDSIVATDISIELLKVMKERRKNVVGCVLHDFDQLFPFSSEYFDYVTCIGALEFSDDIYFTLNEMIRVLKKYGFLLFSVDHLDINSSIQKDRMCVHDKRGFFSKRYSKSEILDSLSRLDVEVIDISLYKAYRLENSWVYYCYYLIRKI